MERGGVPWGQHWIPAFDGRRLAMLRRGLGLSQARFAELVNDRRSGAVGKPGRVTEAVVASWEAGRTRPRARTLYEVASVLAVDPLELLVPGTPLTLSLLRARLGLTQDAVAAQLGISCSVYKKVEQGRRPLSSAEVAALARVLRVPSHWIC